MGTPLYLAPEMLEFNQAGVYTDLWALGCILYEMLVGTTPFLAMTENQVFQKILDGKIDYPKNIDPKAVDLIEKLLTIDPTKRLGFKSYDELKRHLFFEGLDFKSLNS